MADAPALPQKLKTIHAQDLASALAPLYEKYKHLEGQNVMVMFSGGLDTSFITHFLTHVVGAKVTAFFADVGSVTQPENPEEVEARAKEVGAAVYAPVDGKDRLAALGMSAVMAEAQLGNGLGHHPASSLSRVVISEMAVQYAKDPEHNIKALFHGSNGSQNNPYRIRAALKHFQKTESYGIEECTPNLGDTTVARDVQQQYLKAAGISIKNGDFEKNVSHDRNLLGDEWEEMTIADPANAFDAWKAANLQVPPDKPLQLSIRFEKGLPVALKEGGGDFIGLSQRDMLEKLNALGKDYHIGIYDYPEGRLIGIRAREVHIAPAMHMLIEARNRLRGYQLDTETNLKLGLLSQLWSNWVMEQNRWTEPQREKMDEVFKSFGADLNGEVTLTLEAGRIAGFTSPHAAMRMEGTMPPATSEDVGRYVDGRPRPVAAAGESPPDRRMQRLNAVLSEMMRPLGVGLGRTAKGL